MIYVRLSGRLGNQMFQYALGRHLAALHRTELVLDDSFFRHLPSGAHPQKYELNCFQHGARLTTERERKIVRLLCSRAGRLWQAVGQPFSPIRVYRERSFNFDPQVLRLGENVLLDGYWQSEKYFQPIELRIRQDFQFVSRMSDEDSRIAELIVSSKSPVSIHIRRGDLIANPVTHSVHGVCSGEYYDRAVAHMAKYVSDPVFFVFSDDQAWAEANFRGYGQTIFIKHNSEASAYQDLRLMSLCRHHIIANSSFSWWGAWLNPRSEKLVVAPRRWFVVNHFDTRDLIPESWTRL